MIVSLGWAMRLVLRTCKACGQQKPTKEFKRSCGRIIDTCIACTPPARKPEYWTCIQCGRTMPRSKFCRRARRHGSDEFIQPCAECAREGNDRRTYRVVRCADGTYHPGAVFDGTDIVAGRSHHAFDGVVFERCGRQYQVYDGRLVAAP